MFLGYLMAIVSYEKPPFPSEIPGYVPELSLSIFPMLQWCFAGNLTGKHT